MLWAEKEIRWCDCGGKERVGILVDCDFKQDVMSINEAGSGVCFKMIDVDVGRLRVNH